MVNPSLAGRCGLYCGYCEIHRAYKDSVSVRIQLAKKHRCAPGDIVCEGCQRVHARGWSKDPDWGRNCRILKCLGDRGLRFCYECTQLDSCELWGDLAEAYLHLGVDLKENLRQYKHGRVRKWLEEQDRKWRCAHCGNPMIVSSDFFRCHRCGKTPDE